MQTHQEKYHYTECGLDTVYLLNGFEVTETPYGRGVSIHDVDGLHRAIGLQLSEQSAPLSGREFRFIRHELDLSQKALAVLIGVDEQSIARWEKDKTKIPAPAQRLVGAYYRDKVNDEETGLADALERLSALDAEMHRLMTLARSSEDQWIVCAA
ncbi:helix-turn-helix domain-containing protein [Rhodobacter maris]|uniref:DNA-binding transcriptional regulator YiaG n=1 Tax=Rhodobacter maris TaxID=446682 RepID=A0A285S5T8_9RHOB|nr:helix-turn-helix domain-containing protein [Rhodobacter maris]SOC02161.1 DNA-binding transcriptional regulator YiaG [Rhodobacter maris]